MLLDKCNEYFDEIVTALRLAEIAEKKRRDSAIDIKDMDEAHAINADAFAKIMNLRKWIGDLQKINDELAVIFPDFSDGQPTGHEPKPEPEQKPVLEFKPDAELKPVLESKPEPELRFVREPKPEPVPVPKPVLKLKPEPEPRPGRYLDILWTDSRESRDAVGNSDERAFDYPRELVLFGKSYPVNNCKSLIVTFCEALLLKEPYKFVGLAVSRKFNQSILSMDERHVAKPFVKLPNDVYVGTGGSFDKVKAHCEIMLEECGYGKDTLIIRKWSCRYGSSKSAGSFGSRAETK